MLARLPLPELERILSASADELVGLVKGSGPAGAPPAPPPMPTPTPAPMSPAVGGMPDLTDPSVARDPAGSGAPASLVSRATERMKMDGDIPYSTNTLDPETMNAVKARIQRTAPGMFDDFSDPATLNNALLEIAQGSM